MRVLVLGAFLAAPAFVARWVYVKVQIHRAVSRRREADHQRRIAHWQPDEVSDGELLNFYTVRNLGTSYEERSFVTYVPYGAADFGERVRAARVKTEERLLDQNTDRLVSE